MDGKNVETAGQALDRVFSGSGSGAGGAGAGGSAADTSPESAAGASQSGAAGATGADGARQDGQPDGAKTQAGGAGADGKAGAGADGKSGAGTDAGTDPGAGKEAAREAGQEAQGVPEEAADWENLIKVLPDGADAALVGRFAETARAQGLSVEQAKSLMAWQLSEVSALREQMTERGRAELAREWGEHAEANRQAALNVLTRIDRQLGNDAFSRAIGESGVACYPGFVRGLLALAGYMSEDSLKTAAIQGPSAQAETALDGLREIFGK